MIFPVVSVNNMSMNESVAATCCFRRDVMNGNVYETVLSGGSLHDTIQNDFVYNEGLTDKGWLKIQGDFQAALEGNTLRKVTDIFGNTFYGYSYVNSGTDVNVFVVVSQNLISGGDIAVITLADGTTYNYHMGLSQRYCDHTTTACQYIDDVTQSIVRKHENATVEHAAGGANWAQPHNAIRFNS